MPSSKFLEERCSDECSRLNLQSRHTRTKVLGVQGFKDLLTRICRANIFSFAPVPPQLRDIDWCGDTLAFVEEIIVANMVAHLQRAYALSVQRPKRANVYPELDVQDLELIEQLGRGLPQLNTRAVSAQLVVSSVINQANVDNHLVVRGRD